MIPLLTFASAATINLARNPPLRVRAVISEAAVASVSELDPPLYSHSAHLYVSLKTLWIKEYLAFNSLPLVSVQTASDPLKVLKSTIVSYENSQADENDLRAWTRYLAETNNEPPEQSQTEPDQQVLELDVEKFIEYLVEHKHFRPEELEFLRRANLDYGYDQIEDELEKIKSNRQEPKTISIGGENAGPRTTSKTIPTFVIAMCLLTLL